MEAEIETPTAFLLEVSGDARARQIRVRDLIGEWGAKRRGYLIVERVTRDLADAGLVPEPPLDALHIDGLVTLRHTQAPKVPTENERDQPGPGREEAPQVPADDAVGDGRIRVGSLASANRPVVWVSRDQSIERAQTLMMRDDYSQLAVMSGERSLDGAVSWESIARASLRGSVDRVSAALLRSVVVVRLDEDLLETVPAIIENDFVFVQAQDKRICGIVTAADLSLLFVELANPFLIVGEIERSLRRLAEKHFSVEELAAVRDPSDNTREVNGGADLTFGEHKRLLEDPTRWARLEWRIDRGAFLERLEEVRIIRNEVMHFSPDPLGDEDVTKLRLFLRWVRELEPSL